MSDRDTRFNLLFKVTDGPEAKAAIDAVSGALDHLNNPSRFSDISSGLKAINLNFTPSKTRNTLEAAKALTTFAAALGQLDAHKNVNLNPLAASLKAIGSVVKNADKLADGLEKINAQAKGNQVGSLATKIGLLSEKLEVAARHAKDLRTNLGGISGSGNVNLNMGGSGARGGGGTAGVRGVPNRPPLTDDLRDYANWMNKNFTARQRSNDDRFNSKLGRNNIAQQFGGLGSALGTVFSGWKAKTLTAAAGFDILNDKLSGLSGALYNAYRSFEGLYKALTATRVAAYNTLMVSVPTVAAGVGLAMQYGKFKQQQGAINSLAGGEEAGKAFVEQLKQFDIEAPMLDFATTMRIGQNALGKGFTAEELINKKRTGLLQLLNDELYLMGGTAENFEEVIKQLGQAKTGVKFKQQDITALGTSGNLPIQKILKAGLTPERYKSYVGGEALEGPEAVQAIVAGLQKQGAEGAAARGLKELPGKMSTLESSAIKLGIAIGENLEPSVSAAVETITAWSETIRGWHTGSGGQLLKWLETMTLGTSAFVSVIALGIIPFTIISQALVNLVLILPVLSKMWLALVAFMDGPLMIAIIGAAEVLADFILAVGAIPLALGIAAIALWHFRDSVKLWAEDINTFVYNLLHPWTHRNTRAENDEIEEKHQFGLYTAATKGGHTTLSFEDWKAKYAEGQTKGDEATAKNTVAVDANTKAMEKVEKFSKAMKEAQTAFAKEQSGTDSSSGGGGSFGGADEEIYKLRRQGLLGDKEAGKEASLLSLDAAHQKRVDAMKGKEDAREQIKALGEGADDIDSIDDLEEQLAAARIAENKTQITVLTERIRRAKKAESQEHREEREDEKEARHVQRVKEQVFKDRISAFRKYVRALVASGKATRTDASDAIGLLQENHAHELLGMPTSAGTAKVNALIAGFGAAQRKEALIPSLARQLRGSRDTGQIQELSTRLGQARLLEGFKPKPLPDFVLQQVHVELKNRAINAARSVRGRTAFDGTDNSVERRGADFWQASADRHLANKERAEKELAQARKEFEATDKKYNMSKSKRLMRGLAAGFMGYGAVLPDNDSLLHNAGGMIPGPGAAAGVMRQDARGNARRNLLHGRAWWKILHAKENVRIESGMEEFANKNVDRLLEVIRKRSHSLVSTANILAAANAKAIKLTKDDVQALSGFMTLLSLPQQLMSWMAGIKPQNDPYRFATAAYGNGGKRVSVGADQAEGNRLWQQSKDNPNYSLYDMAGQGVSAPIGDVFGRNRIAAITAEGRGADKVRHRKTVEGDGSTLVRFEDVRIDGDGNYQAAGWG